MVRPSGDESKQLPVAEVKPDRSWAHRTHEDLPRDDTVTLTKSQFQQILEAIGQTTSGINGNVNPEYSPVKNKHRNETIVCEANRNVSYDESSESPPTTMSGESGSMHLQVPCPLDVVVSGPASLSWSNPDPELSPSKLSPLSKVEQKRLQWQKEKAEMIEWNPWGKPGAGAPAKKTQIVAPITPRTNNQLLMVQTSGAMPFTSSVPSAMPSCLPSPNCRIFPSNLDHSNFLPNKNFSNYSCVAQPVKPVPPVFKSSIAFGNGDNESVSSDFFKRQQWIKELDFQREEQRRYQEQIQMAQVENQWMTKDETESISISVDNTILPGAADLGKRTYMRGQGFTLDPVSAALADERRLKAQEYQAAIRLQMEEKQRKAEEERERKRKEEEAEERRLQVERQRMQAEYEEEQRRIKMKVEMEERKQQALISAVQQAQMEAEMDRKSKKIHKLIPAPVATQETSSPIKKAEDRVEMQSLSNKLESSLHIQSNLDGPKNGNVQNSPQRSCPAANSHLVAETDSDSADKKELGVQTVPIPESEKSSVYVVDRVLTPSIFRVRAKAGHGREFGTQTDIHYGKITMEDPESTESNTSSFHSPVATKRLVRVQHSKPYKAQRRPQPCNDSIPVNERPKWGVNQPSKSYVRMTERDPHVTKRKKMQELRRQHWANELAQQKASEASSRNRSMLSTSYPSLRSRRAASSSDCTLGYSSSEFETRSYRPFRSNSTPRYQMHPSGFLSDIGDRGSNEHIPHFYTPHHHPTLLSHLPRRRDSQSSDNLPSIIGGSEPSRCHDNRIALFSSGSTLPPMMRRKWHSQETFFTFSPPRVPGVRPREVVDVYTTPQRRKWSDQESFDLESVVRARGVEEGSRGSSAAGSSAGEVSVPSSAGSEKSKSKSPVTVIQNPLVCPEVITGRPTPRQDRILQNLSSLRQGLIKKQKELESLIRRPPPYYS